MSNPQTTNNPDGVISKSGDETLSHIQQTLIQQTTFFEIYLFQKPSTGLSVIMENATEQGNIMEPFSYMEETVFHQPTNPSKMKKYSHYGICNSI